MPRGKTQRSLDLIDACSDILAAMHPATVRGVCYQLFIQGLLPSMAVNETKRVSAQLVYAREQGLLPWSWLVDETRDAERQAVGWNDPEAFIASVSQWYHRDRWHWQPRRFEVWSEKGTVRGILAPVLQQYGVTFRVMHGFASATALYDVAQESKILPMPLEVFYVGDYDPSGLYMSEFDLLRRLEAYRATVCVTRLALTAADTAAGGLPSFPAAAKAKDTRYQWFVERYGRECWEIDALPPPVLRQRVADALEAGIDAEAWARSERTEAAEQQSMRTFFATWKSIAGPDQQ